MTITKLFGIWGTTIGLALETPNIEDQSASVCLTTHLKPGWHGYPY